MDDTISRQAAIDALRGERHGLEEFMDYCLKNEMYGSRYHAKLERNRIDEDILILENLPTAEPEIIRCKDCKWFRKEYGWNCIEYTVCGVSPTHYPIRREEDFCSFAERRNDG